MKAFRRSGEGLRRGPVERGRRAARAVRRKVRDAYDDSRNAGIGVAIRLKDWRGGEAIGNLVGFGLFGLKMLLPISVIAGLTWAGVGVYGAATAPPKPQIQITARGWEIFETAQGWQGRVSLHLQTVGELEPKPLSIEVRRVTSYAQNIIIGGHDYGHGTIYEDSPVLSVDDNGACQRVGNAAVCHPSREGIDVILTYQVEDTQERPAELVLASDGGFDEADGSHPDWTEKKLG